jgi:hypothetical protein
MITDRSPRRHTLYAPGLGTAAAALAVLIVFACIAAALHASVVAQFSPMTGTGQ